MFVFSRSENDMEEMIDDLNRAHKEWRAKEEIFKEVTDPDLVDIAIYEMEASKIKYIYLLKRIKKEMGSQRLVANNKAE
ncbi:MAG: DUF2508 family protein [Tissierellaceae bacterium]